MKTLKQLSHKIFWRLVLGLKLSSCGVCEWASCILGPEFANSSRSCPLFLQKTGNIYCLMRRDFRVILSVPIFAVMKSRLNTVLWKGSLYRRVLKLSVLQGACFISLFLVYLMNFQLSEPLHTNIFHWRARRIVFKITGEVNNFEQCWTLLPSLMLYR